MSSMCRHCDNPCFTTGKLFCKEYTSIASRPERLKKQIKEAYNNNDYSLAKNLTEKLFRLENG